MTVKEIEEMVRGILPEVAMKIEGYNYLPPFKEVLIIYWPKETAFTHKGEWREWPILVNPETIDMDEFEKSLDEIKPEIGK